MLKMSGLVVIDKLFSQCFDCKILVLLMYNEFEYIEVMQDVGVKGYVLKELFSDVLIDVICSIYYGWIVFIVVQFGSDQEKLFCVSFIIVLIWCECEVFFLVVVGNISKQIVELFIMSLKMVENY